MAIRSMEYRERVPWPSNSGKQALRVGLRYRRRGLVESPRGSQLVGDLPGYRHRQRATPSASSSTTLGRPARTLLLMPTAPAWVISATERITASGWLTVTRFDIGRHRNPRRLDDAGGRGDHLVPRRLFPVGITGRPGNTPLVVTIALKPAATKTLALIASDAFGSSSNAAHRAWRETVLLVAPALPDSSRSFLEVIVDESL
jgi:hypothetical protein